jgi:hypothetical protein
MSLSFISATQSSLGVRIVDLVIDPASVATITTAEQTFTLAGLKVTDFVVVSKPTLTAGLGIANARVSAVDTLAVTFVNPTAAGIDAASETYRVLILRPV